MAYDEQILARVRRVLPRLPLAPDEALAERKMFGGVCITLNGKMLAGVSASRLVVRLEEAEFAEASEAGQVTPMDFTGRPMRGFAYVAPEAYRDDEELLDWLERSLRYVRKHMLSGRKV
jgi:TfoX/Sxy family transcriptional regulator of competence genes